jgi:ABC-type uncharacterized transport system ATPase subunit
VAILVGGRVARQGTVEELALGQGRYEIQVGGSMDALARWMAQRNSDVPKITLADDALRVATIDPAEIQPILDQLRALDLVIRRVQLLRPTLEELFMDAVKDHQEQYHVGASL